MPHLTAEQLQQLSLTGVELAHLATCETCAAERQQQTLAFHVAGPTLAAPDWGDEPEPALPWPERIGPWRPTAVLGRGGMGVVYRAVHTERGDWAAVKTLAAVDPFRIRSLRREIAALEAVSHPCIVRILESGLQDGRPWVAMALVDGAPLDGVMADRPRALRVLARVCRTLGWLHGEGLVHLDLKPANILLAEGDRPVLVDFGLVARTRDADGHARLERSDARAGTARYIAPERIRGQPVDARADLYAVGCLVYEALTGRSPLAQSSFDPLNAHLRDAPWPPSWLVDVAPELELLVLRLLAKDPARRPGYAWDVAEAIDAVLGRDPLADALPVPRSSVYRPPLVGRDVDRAWLVDHLATHRLVLVAGPHGIGKTRLVSDLLASPPLQRPVAFAATCPPVDAPPLVGLLPVLEAAVDRALADGVDLPGAAALATLVPELNRLPGVTPAADVPGLDSTVAAVFAAIEVALDGAAGLLAIDDVHCADAFTLAVLERLVRSGDAPDLAVVATWPTEAAEDAIEALVRRLELPVLPLGRLDASGTETLAQGMLAATSVDAEVSRVLHERSGGNPRFAEELLRAAVGAGHLVRDGWGRWSIRADALAATAFPASLDAVLAMRVGALSAGAQALAARASVLVGPFADAHLAALGSVDHLSELRARHVLEPVARGWRFPHEALRVAAGAGLDDAARQALHRAAAAHLDAQPPEERRARLAELARHWGRAGERERARRCAVEAGVDARKQDRLPRAGELCRWAIELERGLPDLAGWQARLVVASAEHVAGADPEGVRGRMQQVRRAAQRAGAWELAGDALLAELWVLRTRWDPAVAPALLDAAAKLDSHLPTASRATLHHDLGVVRLTLGDSAAAAASLQSALGLARACGHRSTELRSLESLAHLAFREARLPDALALHAEVVAGWDQANNPVMLAVARSNQAVPLRTSGQWAAALQLQEQAERTLTRVGQTLYAVHAASQQVEDLLWLGRFDEAWDRATALLARPGTSRAPRRGGIVAQRARAAAGRGDLEAAREGARQATEIDAGSAVFLSLLAVRRVALGEVDVARSARDRLGTLDARPTLTLVVACAHDALAAGDDPEPWLSQARALAAPQLAGGLSADYLGIAGLERAVSAGRTPLIRGSAVQDVPLALRVRLYRDGVIPEALVYF